LAAPALETFRMRHPWLQVNLLTAFAAALVVGIFEDTIDQIIVLAIFLPVLAGQSGNAGCQALATTLHGITLGELESFPTRKLYMKELILVAMTGAGMASGVLGVAVPLTLRRFGADSAMASSILRTTFTDIVGIGLMLMLATALLL
jgi:magnesium transporter